MKRILLGLAIALALAPAAAAKGPHAIIDSGPEGLAPGDSWVTTLTLAELGPRQNAKPRMVLRSGARRFSVWPRRTVPGAYAVRVVFPSAGRWRYTIVSGRHRFRFPAATIGDGGRETVGYVAFPAGSEAAAQGAGGPYAAPPEPEPGDALPPEVVLPEDGDDGGGFSLWIPAAGLTLAGAGGLAVARRRRH